MDLGSNMTVEQIENMRKETEGNVKAVILIQDTRRSEARQQDTRRSDPMRKKWLNTYIVKNIFN